MEETRRDGLDEDAMAHVDNDRWRGVCTSRERIYDTPRSLDGTLGGWQHEFATKFEAGIANLSSEILEGAALLETRGAGGDFADADRLRDWPTRCERLAREVNEIAHLGRAGGADGYLSGSRQLHAIRPGAARAGDRKGIAHRRLV